MQRGIDQITDDRARAIIAEGIVCIAIIGAMFYYVFEVLQ